MEFQEQETSPPTLRWEGVGQERIEFHHSQDNNMHTRLLPGHSETVFPESTFFGMLKIENRCSKQGVL